MLYYKSPRGEDLVKDLILNLNGNEKFKVIFALDMLSTGNTKGLDIKPFRKSIFELKVGKYRVFYTKTPTDIFIIHFLRKDSKKIRNVDVDIVLKRFKSFRHLNL